MPQARGGGRCEACEGNGVIAVEMHFLPTVYVTCDVCNGKRFMKETLEVKYKKKSIYDVLEMTIEEALEFFDDIPAIYDRLKTLDEVGLGISRTWPKRDDAHRRRSAARQDIGRALPPASAKNYLSARRADRGLALRRCAEIIDILNRLVSAGNTVVLIEHNMDVIKSADYFLDFGPEGGVGGGNLVAKGTPEEVANNKNSHTGKYLKRVLKGVKKNQMTLDEFKKKAKKMPDAPGVYFFLDRQKKVLYIGKATRSQDRVRSYFATDLHETRGPIIVAMVEKAKSIDWRQTDSVLEALILEANLIKNYKPKHNTDLKDDKSLTMWLSPRKIFRASC